MIAEEFHYSYQPKSSIPKGTTISCLLACFKKATPFFKVVLNQPDINKPLNENKLTQIFVEQLDIQLRKDEIAIGVKNQYTDIFFPDSKGIPDFYFHNLEEGKSSIPIFIVESKRLPAPAVINKTEYVKGNKLNGGIERFKNEKHGKGQLECGMVGFIESEGSQYWLNEINSWIKNFAKSDNNWSMDELITEVEQEKAFAYLESLVHTNKSRNLKLHHIWINIF